MAPSDPDDRLFREEEIGKILKRATELQTAEPTPSSTGGMTLSELEEIAVEVGIEPRHLRRAAQDLTTPDPRRGFMERVVGEELQVALDATVPGEIADDDFEYVVAVIHESSPEHGQPSLLGRTLTWRAETSSKTRTTQVVVSVRGGETRIRVEERLHQFASAVFAGSMAGGGAGLGVGVGMPIALEVVGSALLAVVFPLGVVGIAYIAARGVYRRAVARRRAAMDRLLSAIVAEVESCVARRARSPAEAPSQLPPGEDE